MASKLFDMTIFVSVALIIKILTLPNCWHLPPSNDLDHERFINGLEVVGHDDFVPIAVFDDKLETKLFEESEIKKGGVLQSGQHVAMTDGHFQIIHA